MDEWGSVMFWTSRDLLKRTVVLAAVLVLTMALAAPAFAGSATQDGYGQPGAQVQGQVQTDSEGDLAAVAAVSDDSGGGGALPFTGLGLAVIAGTGAALLGAGVAMRHLARRPGSTGHSA